MNGLVLLHGFPHTPRLWDEVLPQLRRTHHVLTPDTVAGGDAMSLAEQVATEMTEAGMRAADVVAIDAGVPVALVLALTRPALVTRLVVMEALAGALPGAESFLAKGAPWWFGFHQVPDLPETVLEGHEREYVEWFLQAGTAARRGIDPSVTDAFVAAYTGRDRLAAGFAHYRAMPPNAAAISALTSERSLTMPTLAIGAHPVGPALGAQLSGVTDDLTTIQLDHCGHLIPLDAPERLLAALVPFLS